MFLERSHLLGPLTPTPERGADVGDEHEDAESNEESHQSFGLLTRLNPMPKAASTTHQVTIAQSATVNNERIERIMTFLFCDCSAANQEGTEDEKNDTAVDRHRGAVTRVTGLEAVRRRIWRETGSAIVARRVDAFYHIHTIVVQTRVIRVVWIVRVHDGLVLVPSIERRLTAHSRSDCEQHEEHDYSHDSGLKMEVGIHERRGFTPTRLSVEVEKVVLNELHNSVELFELATDDSEALHVGFAEIGRCCVSHELAEVICDILKVR